MYNACIIKRKVNKIMSNIEDVFKKISIDAVDDQWYKVDPKYIRKIFNSACNIQDEYPLVRDVYHQNINNLEKRYNQDEIKRIWKNELREAEIEVYPDSGDGIDSQNMDEITNHVCDVTGNLLAREWERYIVNGNISPRGITQKVSPTAIYNHSDITSQKANRYAENGYVLNHSSKSITAEAVKNTIYYMSKEYRANAKWYMCLLTGHYLMSTKDDMDNNIIDPRSEIIKVKWFTESVPTRMIGKDIKYSKWIHYPHSDLYPIVLADLASGYYAIRDEDETFVRLNDNHLDFKFLVGGTVVRPEAFKVIKMETAGS